VVKKVEKKKPKKKAPVEDRLPDYVKIPILQ
jgi:hypothetical protein